MQEDVGCAGAHGAAFAAASRRRYVSQSSSLKNVGCRRLPRSSHVMRHARRKRHEPLEPCR